jgi:hypothetical protein
MVADKLTIPFSRRPSEIRASLFSLRYLMRFIQRLKSDVTSFDDRALVAQGDGLNEIVFSRQISEPNELRSRAVSYSRLKSMNACSHLLGSTTVSLLETELAFDFKRRLQ